MAQRPDTPDSPRSGEMGYVLEAARGSLAHQFEIAERLDSKARGQMTLAGAWFAVAQGVAGFVLSDSALPLGWTIAVVASAAVAALGLVVAFYQHYRVWKLREQTDLSPEALMAFEQDVRNLEVDAPATMVGYYAEMLGTRQAMNHRRERAFQAAVPAWFAALGLTLIELLAAVCAAILG